MQLDPKTIRVDGGTQPRAELLIEVMEDYAEQMLGGVEFPPITVFFDGKDYWLVDGFHRLGAHQRVRPNAAIEAEVIQGTQTEAQWYSLGANKTHGLRRTPEDRRRAVQAALRHPTGSARSDREIAEHIGVSHHTVGKYREQLQLEPGGQFAHLENGQSGQKRKGRDGKDYPARRTASHSGNGKRDKPSRHMASRIHHPIRAPSPLEKMTTVTLPHNPVMGARTLIEVFDTDYLRAVVEELSRHLKGLAR